jgi:hypothetical protein
MFGWSRLQLGICAGAVVVAITALSFAGCERSNAKAARAAEAQALAALEAATLANASNQTTIADLERSVADWRKLATPNAQMVALAAQARAAAEELRKARAALDASAQETDNANPDCAALLATDFERVCPFYARRLRERAAGGDGDRDGPRPRSGGAEDPGQPAPRVRGAVPLQTRRDAAPGRLGAPGGG